MRRFTNVSHQWLRPALLVSSVLSLASVATPAQAAHGSRDLTLYIQDYIQQTKGGKANLDWNAPGAPSREEVETLINARPVLSGPEQIYETEHFVIHYTTEGRDAATMDQVMWAAESGELVWNREINELGYPAPPADNGRGGDDRYDVYWTFQIGTYGYCSGETFTDENSMTSYLALGQWMNEVETQVTFAHEFFHAIHFTMDALEETWLFETSATWMEDQVYDDINDYYNYLDDPFSSPETPINSSTSIMYGYAIWDHSLSERFGIDIIQDIWFQASESATPNALAVTASVVEQDYGVPFAQQLQHFRESMFDLSRFSEGADYAIAIGDGTAGEVSFTTSVDRYETSGSGEVEATGCNLIEFQAVETTAGTLTINFDANTGVVASVLGEKSDGTVTELFSDTMTGVDANFSVSNFGTTYKRVVLVVSNVLLSGSTTFSYTASVPEWEGGGGCTIAPTSSTGSNAGTLVAALAVAGLIARRRRQD